MPATPPAGSPNLQAPLPEEHRPAPAAASDWPEPDLTENGLTLARRFYESCGAPLLAERVPDLADRIAAGKGRTASALTTRSPAITTGGRRSACG